MPEKLKKNTRKNSNKPTKDRVQRWRCTALIVGAAIASVVLLWFLTRNTSIYAPGRDVIKSEVESILSLASTGKQVYSEAVDRGCDSGSSVGLSIRIDCSFIGQRYLVDNANLKEQLHLLDAKLVDAGWQRYV